MGGVPKQETQVLTRKWLLYIHNIDPGTETLLSSWFSTLFFLFPLKQNISFCLFFNAKTLKLQIKFSARLHTRRAIRPVKLHLNLFFWNGG